MGQTIDEYTAEVLFLDDLLEAELSVKDLILSPLGQNQFDALVSWTFNLGRGALESSSLRKALNLGDYASVPAQISRWVHVKEGGVARVEAGLVKRRAQEARLFKDGVYHEA